MTPKKPDRFERIGEILSLAGEHITGYDVANSLRKEHRWMARMIRTMKVPPWEVADVLSRRGILERLERRAK